MNSDVIGVSMSRSQQYNQSPRNLRFSGRGFTLIELMMVIAIVAIILTFSIPSYREYVLRANRTEAMNFLLDTAACQERVYTKINQYDANRCIDSALSANGLYSVTMTTSDADQNFLLTAVPQGAQADDSCGDLTLTNTGIKGSSKAVSDVQIADCWRGKRISGGS
jgi:type IV pilus assembly protein PilE